MAHTPLTIENFNIYMEYKKTEYMSYFAKDETMKLRLEYSTWHLPTLSQKQLGKYLFQQGIVPSQYRNYAGTVFFQEICIQQGARNYFLYLGNISLR